MTLGGLSRGVEVGLVNLAGWLGSWQRLGKEGQLEWNERAGRCLEEAGGVRQARNETIVAAG